MRKKIELSSLILLSLLSGCDDITEPSVFDKQSISVTYQFDIVETVGNLSYIPINKSGIYQDMIKDILKMLDEFAKQREIFIISYNVEKKHDAHEFPPAVLGVWVTHIPINQTFTLKGQ